MSSLRRVPFWLVLSAVAGVLGTALVVLCARTPGYGELHYVEDIAVLRQLRQLDASWELDALRSKVGLNGNYDPLAEHLRELQTQRRELEALVAGHAHDDAAGLAAADAALQSAIDEKIRLVERFKSHNAVLRNSLAYLPTAAEDVAAGAEGAVLGEAVEHLLLASLEFVQLASDERAEQLQADLAGLAAQRARLPAGLGERVELFAAHARTVLTEQRAVNGLLERIAAVPVASGIDEIAALLSEERQQAGLLAEQFRRYLSAFSLVLVALLIYAAAGLVRSHAEIRRVNRELQQANAGLEARVDERTRELRAAQDELVATARRAGMAEIATNVLHNVGNVLNSVNVSAGVVAQRVRASKARELGRVVALLDAHADAVGAFLEHDPKGRILPQYLGKLDEAMAAEREETLAEVDKLTRSIDHIKDIVATQQSYAGSLRMVEPMRVRELVEDALRMNAAALGRHEVEVVRRFTDDPELPLDRHRVLQILVNLISNAKHAMDGIAERAHRLTVGLQLVEAADGRWLHISVADVGQGIAAEDLSRIFNHGFTTRKDGHGFGLHSCALAAREMGGRLVAHSDGPGRGALFSLELPIDPPRV